LAVASFVATLHQVTPECQDSEEATMGALSRKIHSYANQKCLVLYVYIHIYIYIYTDEPAEREKKKRIVCVNFLLEGFFLRCRV